MQTYSRAMLTMTLSEGKLFKILACVRSPKQRYPVNAIVKQASIDTPVE